MPEICPFRIPREPFMPAGVPFLIVYVTFGSAVFRELAGSFCRYPHVRVGGL
jgi:hypothetical protein